MDTYTRQLKELKDIIKPDSRWKSLAKKRIISFAQKSYGTEAEEKMFLSRSFFPPSFSIRLSFAFLLILIILLTPSILVASKSARPGQLLYPFKRLLEEGRVKIAKSSKEQEELMIQFSQMRVLELEESVFLDKEENQLKAAEEVRSSVKELMHLVKDEKRQDAFKKIKLKLMQIKQKATSAKVLNSVDKALDILSHTNKTYEPFQEQDLNPPLMITPASDSIFSPKDISPPTPTTILTNSPNSPIRIELDIEDSLDLQSRPSPSPNSEVLPTITKAANTSKIVAPETVKKLNTQKDK